MAGEAQDQSQSIGRTLDLSAISVAVLLPCYNEEAAIGATVAAFRRCLPHARIYVYDNNSKDRTAEAARAAGAIVRSETMQGKGNVVRRMFSDVDADVYLLCDGDCTYDAAAAPRLIATLLEGHYDMVSARRIDSGAETYRPGHRFGNRLLTGLVAAFFGERTKDMLTGYRAFSNRFVKSFPALSRGFEIETELTVHALELRMPIIDVETAYFARPEGSVSKLNTFSDGVRILKTILLLVKEERPLEFFSAASALLAAFALAIAAPVFVEFFATGLVPRLPTAVFAAAVMIVALMALVCGLILETVTLGRREMKRLSYLSFRGPDQALQKAQMRAELLGRFDRAASA